MNKSLLLTIFLGAAAITGVLYSTQSSKSGNFLAEIKYMNEFKLFINDYQKQYSADEFVMRHSIFSETLDIIQKQNDLYDAGLSTYYLGVNILADLTTQEIKKNYLGSMQNKSTEIETETEAIDNNVNAPQSIDWVTLGKVNAVKNQGQCGSCWAFSATGSLESLHAIKTNNLLSFAEQSIVDCAGRQYGCNGCNGGWPYHAMEYVQSNGIPLESSYPYTAKDGQCRSYTSVFKNTGQKYVQHNSEQSLVNALAQQPVSVLIEADQRSFQMYRRGIFSNSDCGIQVDHAVIAVGYGSNYYKIRNSWGASWGDQGYIYFAKTGNGAGQCGVQQKPSYPTLN